jgi:hypothetical protein
MANGKYIRTPEHRLKMSLAHKGLAAGEKNPMYKHKYTPETLKKMSESHKGYVTSEATKKKLSLAMRGRYVSPETRKKKSEAMNKIYATTNLKERLSKMWTGKNNPMYGKPAWTKGKKGIYSEEFRKKISDNAKARFANPANHPMWKGGKSYEPYTLEFNTKFKNAIRKRDNQVCMVCGIHREKLTQALDVHHINYDKALSVEQNGVSCCHSCHSKTNVNRKYWINFFQQLLHDRYGYNYTEDNVIKLKL